MLLHLNMQTWPAYVVLVTEVAVTMLAILVTTETDIKMIPTFFITDIDIVIWLL